MLAVSIGVNLVNVALLTEGVDRNILNPLGYYMDYARRPPHGGRG